MLAGGESYGIDVASFQGSVQWPVVVRQHISFAYIKATQGITYVNPFFAADWDEAAAAHLPHGAYAFFSLCSSGVAQARRFLAVVPADPAALPPALDLELGGNCSTRPPAAEVAAQLAAFTAAVEAATRRPVVLYVGLDFAARYRSALPVVQPLWLRRTVQPSAPDVVIWQPKQTFQVAGIVGPVDLDLARLATLRRLRT